MIRPITYTYKGRPLAPFGSQKSARTLKRRRMIRSALLTGSIVLLILGGIAALVWWISTLFRSDAVPGEEMPDKGTPQQETLFPESAGKSGTETAVPSAGEKALPAPAASGSISESADRQAFRVYSAAASAFQKKDYEGTRKALRLFFEKFQVPPGHPLYDRACAMLSDASLAIYRSGSDPADWKIHKVERGENLSRIAKKYGTDVQTVTDANGLTGTALRIGQTLRIPQGSWRLRIERKNRRLLLDNSGRLFKIYSIGIGPRGETAGTGVYRIRRQQTPERIFFTGASSRGSSAMLHTQEEGLEPEQKCFVMKKGDLEELLRLIPEKTPAEILK